MYLTPTDVRITPQISSACIEITATDAAYDQVKNLLMALRDITGIRIDCRSEENAAFFLARRKEGVGDGSIKILTDVAVPRTATNEFLVPAWRNNIRSAEQLNALSEEVAAKFREAGLTCKVFSC